MIDINLVVIIPTRSLVTKLIKSTKHLPPSSGNNGKQLKMQIFKLKLCK
ncbi:MAG: hypothetical protein IKM20_09845 [Erysipelotrichales bacterium]|nr:hypothetical protein [Erysipelotrichales bacterium]